jgi:predicted  nucleic acid-binding Zn-ribbon protein
MPHMCTRCDCIFEGGEDILKGCPKCGWKKFIFLKNKESHSPNPTGIDQQQPYQLITEAMGVRIPARKGHAKPPSNAGKKLIDNESAQFASAKSDLSDNISLSYKTKQIEEKLESVRITDPGTYELNLPTLFERDELIMAVKEGTYFIDLSSAFKKSKKD